MSMTGSDSLPNPSRLCHFCGERSAGSRDHFIPKSGGNSGRVQVHFASGQTDGILTFSTRTYQNGFWTGTACTDCNTKMKRLATAYKHFIRQFADPSDLRDMTGRRLIDIGNVFLSRAIGQMYAMLISIMPVAPMEKWKPLRDWLLNPDALPVPNDLPRVLLYLNKSSFGRIVPPCGIVEFGTGGGALIAEVSLPPVGIIFEFGEYDRTSAMADISEWISEPYDKRGRATLAVPEYVLHANTPLAFGTASEYAQLERERGGIGYLFKSDDFDVLGLGAFIRKE